MILLNMKEIFPVQNVVKLSTICRLWLIISMITTRLKIFGSVLCAPRIQNFWKTCGNMKEYLIWTLDPNPSNMKRELRFSIVQCVTFHLQRKLFLLGMVVPSWRFFLSLWANKQNWVLKDLGLKMNLPGTVLLKKEV